jgi:hypothetical protein
MSSSVITFLGLARLSKRGPPSGISDRIAGAGLILLGERGAEESESPVKEQELR